MVIDLGGLHYFYREFGLYFRFTSSGVADRKYLLPLESELWLSSLIQIPTQLYKIAEVGWPAMPALTLFHNGPIGSGNSIWIREIQTCFVQADSRRLPVTPPILRIIRANLIISFHLYCCCRSLAQQTGLCGVWVKQGTPRCPLPCRVFQLYVGKEPLGEYWKTWKHKRIAYLNSICLRVQVTWNRADSKTFPWERLK